MRDFRTKLTTQIYDLLSGMTDINSNNVSIYSVIPTNTDKPYVFIGNIESNRLSGCKEGFMYQGVLSVIIYDTFNLSTSLSWSYDIADKIKQRLKPTKSFNIDLGSLFQVIVWDLVSDDSFISGDKTERRMTTNIQFYFQATERTIYSMNVAFGEDEFQACAYVIDDVIYSTKRIEEIEADAEFVYIDEDLTTLAPTGYYSDNTGWLSIWEGVVSNEYEPCTTVYLHNFNYNEYSSSEACAIGVPLPYYSLDEDIGEDSVLYNDEALTSIAADGYYSNTVTWYRMDRSVITEVGNCAK